MAASGDGAKHKNDMYGDVDDPRSVKDVAPAVPAATVVLLRDTDDGPEVLMLRKNSRIAFRRHVGVPRRQDRHRTTSRKTATRTSPPATPPPAKRVRKRGWSSIPAPSSGSPTGRRRRARRSGLPPGSSPPAPATTPVSIDGGEIEDHRWIRPADALAKHAGGDIDLVPPTWVTPVPPLPAQPRLRRPRPLRRPRSARLQDPRGQGRRRHQGRDVDRRRRLRRLERRCRG